MFPATVGQLPGTIKSVTICVRVQGSAHTRHPANKLTEISAVGIDREDEMRIGRRSALGGLVCSPIAVLGSGASAQASSPSDASQIEVAKAKAEGKVVLYTSLDTQIVDAIIAPFKETIPASVISVAMNLCPSGSNFLRLTTSVSVHMPPRL